MRTTVTIEPDLAQELKQRAVDRGTSFKAVLNEALRSGLQRNDEPAGGQFVQSISRMGIRPGVDLTKANRLAAELEDAEIVRKLEQGR